MDGGCRLALDALVLYKLLPIACFFSFKFPFHVLFLRLQLFVSELKLGSVVSMAVETRVRKKEQCDQSF